MWWVWPQLLTDLLQMQLQIDWGALEILSLTSDRGGTMLLLVAPVSSDAAAA